MGEFSLSHWLIIALILLVLFGPTRLPALGQSIGKAIRGFKQGLNEIDGEAKDIPQNANYRGQDKAIDQDQLAARAASTPSAATEAPAAATPAKPVTQAQSTPRVENTTQL